MVSIDLTTFQHDSSWQRVELGKLKALDDLLDIIYARTDEKVVLVSSYTATLDVLAALCKLRRYKHLRLDGSVAQKSRQVCVSERWECR